jgi:Flp pilus assembly protein TadD
MSVRRILGLPLLAVALGLAACGGQAYPPADTTPTKTAISAAEAVNAPSVPQAALHLKMAKDQLTTAESLLADGENDEAYLVLERARADAELSMALAKEAGMRAQAAEAIQKINKLTEQ